MASFPWFSGVLKGALYSEAAAFLKRLVAGLALFLAVAM
jgi:hypothetical protein